MYEEPARQGVQQQAPVTTRLERAYASVRRIMQLMDEIPTARGGLLRVHLKEQLGREWTTLYGILLRIEPEAQNGRSPESGPPT